MADKKMNFNATWAMAVGGMVGGGIFSVLGVIVAAAGQWAWLSFTLAGLVAFVSAYSFSQLSIKYGEGGGPFTYLLKVGRNGMAGSISWILVLGYLLTISVYAYTFGHYVANAIGGPAWLPPALAVTVICSLAAVNLRGVGDSSRLEVIAVWGKLAVLLGLSLYGIFQWNPGQLTAGIDSKSWTSAVVGAATIFMGYEGFELLSYDYEDLDNPKKTLPRATLTAVISVVVIYVLVTIGTTMLVGAETLIEKKEVAIAIAGQQAFGITGLIVVTIAAAFSTASAINATLFSTSRLMETVSKKKDLPHFFSEENKSNIPYYAILTLAGFACALTVIGSLGSLVNSASLIFLFTFGTVNFLAYHEGVKRGYFCLAGAIACAVAIVVSTYKQVQDTPVVVGISLSVVAAIFVGWAIYIKKKND